ncbi:hypothetical protein HZS_1917, partial [Henneguya salminicola]
MSIKSIFAREIFDSRGNPTVEVDLHTAKGMFRAAVPSGASTGVHEAVELRDGGHRLMGKGVLKAVSNVNDVIAPALIGKSVLHQKEVDDIMIKLDGTPNKGKLGANAILAVSMAVSSHYIVMILPTGAKTFKEAMTIGAEVYHNLKKLINSKYGLDATNVGDEGGFAPNIQNNEEGLILLREAIKKANYEGLVEIGMDVAASEFYQEGSYNLDFKSTGSTAHIISGKQLGDLYRGYIKDFPIVSIEDAFE